MSPTPDHGEESYRRLGRLQGRIALITGGDSGIGRAVTIAFAREGADLAISHLPEEQQDAEESARWVERAGRQALRFPGDVRDEKYC
jgi:NAD(P)-dependent dehydrogenase (short-subunit alcohol dehydrogenase family)